MERESPWRITWNPAGATPRVLLEFGDPMDGEIQRDLVQVVDVGRFDQAILGRPYGRKNRKRRLEFNRLVEFASNAEAFVAMLEAAANDPWGEKQLVQIAPMAGGSAYGRAALLSVDRQFVTQPFPGFSERYAFRIDGGSTAPGTPAITIIGGVYNPPIAGGGTTSGSITVNLGSGHGLVVGDVVYVSGVSGVANGYYPVTGVNGNNVTVAASSSQPGGADVYPDITGEDGSGIVRLNLTTELRISGLTEVGAAYAWKFANQSTVLLQPITEIDPYGRAVINRTVDADSINYQSWEGALLNPLPIDGQNHNYTHLGSVYTVSEWRTQQRTHVELWKNGAKVDEHKVLLNWTTEKHYQAGGPTLHDIPAGKTLVLTLRADGGTARQSTGFAEAITGGTIQKAD
jgi:hypothetical protein